MVMKTIVCLADSFRPKGSCVAGIEIVNGNYGKWVRPISHRADEAISELEKTYADGTKLALLDIVEISFDAHRPEHHQTENWLISQNVKWNKKGQLALADLPSAVIPTDAPLWRPAQSTSSGSNDYVTENVAHQFTCSLILVRPDTAEVIVSRNPFSNKDEVWVSFRWAETDHKMKLTDPVQFDRFAKAEGYRHTLQNPFLCISLAEVWKEKQTASMLVAGLIP